MYTSNFTDIHVIYLYLSCYGKQIFCELYLYIIFIFFLQPVVYNAEKHQIHTQLGIIMFTCLLYNSFRCEKEFLLAIEWLLEILSTRLLRCKQMKCDLVGLFIFKLFL